MCERCGGELTDERWPGNKGGEVCQMCWEARRTVLALARDDSGGTVSLELILVGTVLGIGVLAGLKEVRDSINGELLKVADRITNLSEQIEDKGQIEAQLAPTCLVVAGSRLSHD